MSSLAAFRSVTLVGSVLPADAITKAADLALPGQKPDDYLLTPGVSINAAAARAWADLTGAWQKREAALQTAAGDGATRYTRERWLLPLLAELGYGRVPALPSGVDLPPGLGETSTAHYPISHHLAWPIGDPDPSAAVAIHLLGNDIDLDKRTQGATARAPHAMVQEFLNRTDTYLFALLSNGRVLRLLRDASSLAKQSYIEFDLDLMFREQLFSDFRLLYVLLHATRLTPRTPDAPNPQVVAPRPPEPDDSDDNEDEEVADELADVALSPTGPRATDCWIEQWRTLAIEDGSRAREQLEQGVAAAITALGTGFVRHPANQALIATLKDSPDADQDLRRWILRLVYQLIVLFVAEDRDLLHPPAVSDADRGSRALYREHFSSARLRHLAQTRTGSRHSDLWDQLQIVFTGLGTDGVPTLGLPALTPSLYGPDRTGLLSSSRLSNRYLLEAIRHLSLITDPRTGLKARVDYRNLDSEELGGVYEGILGYVPRYDPDAGTFTLTTAAGSDRKKSGSYYTPSSLISLILDEALDPMVDTALRDAHPEEAILKLTVVDPACGSGHFLVAAARRLARALATARTGDPEPSPTDLQSAIRDIVSTCLFGVDLNDLAIDLAKVALWLEALTPGKPFAYLDHHLKVGNALLGTTPALLAKNVPDEAFAVLDGDDKDYTKKLKSRNKAERQHDERQAAGQYTFDMSTLDFPTVALSKRAAEIDLLGSDTIDQVRARADAWRALEADPELESQRLVADAWCATFVQPKPDGDPPHAGVTHATIANLRRDPTLVPAPIHALVTTCARGFRFFHWHLEFPTVFTVPEGASSEAGEQGWIGGFSAVIGNPPWERLKIQDEEWFNAAGRPDIAMVSTASRRAAMIADLESTEPSLHKRYLAAQRGSVATRHFLARSGVFPWSGRGDINVAYCFAERGTHITAATGRQGVLVPSGLVTDATMAPFFDELCRRRSIVSVRDFRNTGFFAGVASAQGVRFCALSLIPGGHDQPTQYVFRATSTAEALDPDRIFELTPDEIALLNPNTRNISIFLRRKDADLTLRAYRRHPALLVEDNPHGNPWGLSFQRMFDMANSSGQFLERHQLDGAPTWERENAAGEPCVPMYEAKMLRFYNDRHGDYATVDLSSGRGVRRIPTPSDASLDNPRFDIQPRYWIRRAAVSERLSGRWDRRWLLGWRDICTSLDERTLTPCVLPVAGVGHKFLLAMTEPTDRAFLLHASWSSLACDFVARQKISGTSMAYFVLKQIAVPHPTTFDAPAPWLPALTWADWIRPYVLELSYTHERIRAYAEDLGDTGSPFRWDPDRRASLRAELDAAFMHLYGFDRGDAEHVLDSFPITRRYEMRDHGEYRTQRLVLDAYDRMADAIGRMGVNWVGLLDQPAGKGPRHEGMT